MVFFQEHKTLLVLHGGKRSTPRLSELVHAKFTALHPYCKLSPAILMTKCYTWKSAIEKGTLNIDMKIMPKTEKPASDTTSSTQKVILPSVIANVENNSDYKPAKKEKRSNSRDLVLRTWTQEMIDNMLLTRKNAMAKKKTEEKGTDPVANMTDIW